MATASANRIRRSIRMVAIFAMCVGMISSGCGDDEPAPTKKKPVARGRGANTAKAAAKAGKAKKGVQIYAKIDESLRRTFLERDFRPDIEGKNNRDPFRSYIIRQPGLRDPDSERTDSEDKLCKNTKRRKNWKAPTYSLRDLTLIGIITRGTKGYAQFLDRSGEGWIVTQNNCLGVEKAIVSAIGTGVVRLQIRPEAPLGGTAPEPVAKDIPLYPQEYEIEATELDDGQ